MYGLSLSFCVSDILSGDVSENDVTAIISSTKFDSMSQAVERYSITYWRKYDQSEVEALVARLWPKVIQVRLYGLPAHSIADYYWLEVPEGEYPLRTMQTWVSSDVSGGELILAKIEGLTYIPMQT